MGVAPTSPGIPERHSTPPSPRPTASVTSMSHGSPAAAVTVASPPEVSNRRPRVAMRTTRPSKPASETTTFDPPPRSTTDNLRPSAQRSASTTAASSAASRKCRAGPPSSSVVNGASGTPSRITIATSTEYAVSASRARGALRLLRLPERFGFAVKARGVAAHDEQRVREAIDVGDHGGPDRLGVGEVHDETLGATADGAGQVQV